MPVELSEEHPPFRWRNWMLPFAAAVLALAAWYGWATGEMDPAVHLPMANFPADLAHVAEEGGWEMLLLYAVLRPWSYRRSWGRAGLAALLLLPWVLFNLLFLHQGPAMGMHTLWLLAMEIALIRAMIVSSGAAPRRRMERKRPR
jgi:hypothetical protein